MFLGGEWNEIKAERVLVGRTMEQMRNSLFRPRNFFLLHKSLFFGTFPQVPIFFVHIWALLGVVYGTREERVEGQIDYSRPLRRPEDST